MNLWMNIYATCQSVDRLQIFSFIPMALWFFTKFMEVALTCTRL